LKASSNPAAPRVYFREDQRFRQPFLWIPLILGSAVASGTTLWMIARQVVGGIPFGDYAMSNEAMLAAGAVVLCLNFIIILFFAVACLQIEVNDRGLFLRFFPMHRKARQISLDEVTSITAVQYQALLDYGGYGIRKYPRSTAYNVRGEDGVRIDYENGCHVLLGTQHPEALFQALKHVLESTDAADG
jgi:hypothetical protein